ncbi:MAG: glutathione peroxidase [Acidocella sp. 35-58-6]|jgi:glutathione peroxidase|nr:MAG: glutathione peroxidase [Acidocella sp. 35-58-6]
MSSAYDFSFETLQGQPYPLKDLSGRPLVVVNTASKCGFTPQYKGLEALWRDHKESGLVVIGVPSNDFGAQEPGSADEISAFCELNYGVDFPMMAKVHVKGANAHPFFKWAGSQGGFMASPKWNFFKYLVGKDGQLMEWFSSITAPESEKFQAAISKLLGR